MQDFMKKFLFFAVIFAGMAVTAPACAPKTGCPANESLKADMSKTKKKKGSNSDLFPKNMKKKMGHSR
ncbi:MAG: hypothetical protein RL013_1876 [Bacteroidota bacterium]|jgi:hypothetical protein